MFRAGRPKSEGNQWSSIFGVAAEVFRMLASLAVWTPEQAELPGRTVSDLPGREQVRDKAKGLWGDTNR